MVSIILPCLNHWETTAKCLESLEKWTDLENNEIILVDDGSSDDTRLNAVNTLDYNYTIIRHWPTNRGFACAVNRGIEASSGDYIAVMNNDMLVGPFWLDNLLEGFELNPDFQMLTSWIVGSKACTPQAFDDWATSQWPHQPFVPGLWAKGGPWVFRTKVFRQIGLFDEAFQYGQYEDVDYMLRMAKAHMLWGMYKRSIVYHFGSVTQHGELRRRVGNRYIRDNQIKFRTRWGTAHITPERIQMVYENQELIPDGL